MEKIEATFCGKELSIQSGHLAKQANGSVVVRYGESVVLVTVCASKENKKDAPFFPLSCDYIVKTYSQGRIPKGFIKRETKPSDHESLVSRLIDRPIRPLFPDNFMAEVQVAATVLSYDPDASPVSAALIGASAALNISDIPFEYPVGGVFVGMENGEFVINPNPEVLDKGPLNLFLAATKEAIAMVEADADEVDEETMIKALEFGHKHIKDLIAIQEKLKKSVGKAKREYDLSGPPEEQVEKIAEFATPLLKEGLAIKTKMERYEALAQAKKQIVEEFSEEKEGRPASQKHEIAAVIEDVKKTLMRDDIVKRNLRVDGRKNDEIRPIECEKGLLPRAHGSAIFTRGETQALVVATLGSKEDEQMVDDPTGNFFKKFYLHYNFPGYCVGECKRIGPPKRREVGHGKLAERGLFRQLPDYRDFPYTIRLVSEVLESNGSSSMATVCAGTLALFNAGAQLKAPVAGIAMGLISQNKKSVVLSDILGDEDHIGDMDFKVVGTEKGICALQMDIKIKGLTKKLLGDALKQARKGRLHILGEMAKTISAPEENLSEYAPKFIQHKIASNQIREIIGPGGSVIKGITAQTGARIDVNDSGVVNISSSNQKNAVAALRIIQDILKSPQIGEVYEFRIKRIQDKGLVVEKFNDEWILPYEEFEPAKTQEDFKLNDKISCKVTGYDKRKKLKISVCN